MQEPHEPIPQPNLVPVSASVSRSAQSSGVSGETSTDRAVPFTMQCDHRVLPGRARGGSIAGLGAGGRAVPDVLASSRHALAHAASSSPSPWSSSHPRPAAQSTFFLPPSAVLTNYDRVLIGQEEALESGAFVARVADSTAGWYNPAGLALVRRSVIGASATGYELEMIDLGQIQTAHRKGHRWPSSPATSAPCWAGTSSPPIAGASASRPPSPPPGRRR